MFLYYDNLMVLDDFNMGVEEVNMSNVRSAYDLKALMSQHD